MKLLPLVILLTLLLNGCISSSYLASVGARATHGSVDLDTNDELKVQLIDSERNVGTWALMHGFVFPYMNLYPDKEGNKFAKVHIDPNDIEWTTPNKNRGKIFLDINGVDLEFLVTKKSDQLKLIHEHRDWYGYPLQGLLIVTIPLDVVIGAIGAVVMLVAAPFIVD